MNDNILIGGSDAVSNMYYYDNCHLFMTSLLQIFDKTIVYCTYQNTTKLTKIKRDIIYLK